MGVLTFAHHHAEHDVGHLLGLGTELRRLFKEHGEVRVGAELFRILLGIDSQSPGFQKIRIAPSLCTLKEVSGTMPHPHGFIRTAYQVDKRGKLTAHIELPQGTSGVFAWKGTEYPLKAGKQTIVAR